MHYCVYVILPSKTNIERRVMSLLKETVPGLTFDVFDESQARYGGRWDGVLLKERRKHNKLANNIIEIEKLDFDFFLPYAMVTPNGELFDVESMDARVAYMELMTNTNEDGEFVRPVVTKPLSEDALEKEYDRDLRHYWKHDLLSVTSNYPGHFVVCCDVHGN